MVRHGEYNSFEITIKLTDLVSGVNSELSDYVSAMRNKFLQASQPRALEKLGQEVRGSQSSLEVKGHDCIDDWIKR